MNANEKGVMNMALHPFRQLDVLRSLSIQGNRITDCYRLLYKTELWTKAYANLYPHESSITKEGFQVIVQELIGQFKAGTFRFLIVKKVYRSKKPCDPVLDFKNELVREVIRLILYPIYNPIFSQHSYGWHEGESCHTALTQIQSTWSGLTWAIQGEMNREINPSVLMKALAKKIDDRRFLLLVHNACISGGIEAWTDGDKNDEKSQSRLLLPLLTAIYFHEFDLFMEEQMKVFDKRNVPMDDKKRTSSNAVLISKGRKHLEKNVQRMKYIRYADEFMIGIAGNKASVLKTKYRVEQFLREYLFVSLERFVFAHLESPIPFLNYEISILYRANDCRRLKSETTGRSIQLKIPLKKIREFGFVHNYGQIDDCNITYRPKLIHQTEWAILMTYNKELADFANYYKLARNQHHLAKLFYMAERSFVQTIAHKRRSTTAKVAKSMKRHKQNVLCLVRYNKNGDQDIQSLMRLKDILKVESVGKRT